MIKYLLEYYNDGFSDNFIETYSNCTGFWEELSLLKSFPDFIIEEHTDRLNINQLSYSYEFKPYQLEKYKDIINWDVYSLRPIKKLSKDNFLSIICHQLSDTLEESIIENNFLSRIKYR